MGSLEQSASKGSHLGRPNGQKDEKFSMKPVAKACFLGGLPFAKEANRGGVAQKKSLFWLAIGDDSSF